MRNSSKEEALIFMNSSRENIHFWNVVESDDDDNRIIINVNDNNTDPEFDTFFSISRNGIADSFKIESKYQLLIKCKHIKFVELMNEYCKNGNRSITEILRNGSEIYKQIESIQDNEEDFTMF